MESIKGKRDLLDNIRTMEKTKCMGSFVRHEYVARQPTHRKTGKKPHMGTEARYEDGPRMKMVHNFSKTQVGCGRYTGEDQLHDNSYIAGQKDALNNLLIKY